MPKPDHVPERPYHHGDLRHAVVVAALEILSETQSLEFSLRELARRAGVSHNAPYKHFADKRELLAAVSAVGFEQLTKRMSDKIAGLSNGNSAPARTSTPLAGAFCCSLSRLLTLWSFSYLKSE
jgi:AcrR family transcriptional regulator